MFKVGDYVIKTEDSLAAGAIFQVQIVYKNPVGYACRCISHKDAYRVGSIQYISVHIKKCPGLLLFLKGLDYEETID